MGYAAKIVKDSISPDGVRLTSFELTFPRFILAEVNTHCIIAKSSASSRAIPVHKRIAMIEADPFIPEEFGKNQRGMQASEMVTGTDAESSKQAWLSAIQEAVSHAKILDDIGVHKQHANRLLEPFAWHTALLTATEWENFFNLRTHADAQPEFQKIAKMARELYETNTPTARNYGEWHLPYVDDDEAFDAAVLVGNDGMVSDREVAMISSARCARLSYLTQDGVRDQRKDLDLATSLFKRGHMSPFEHIGRVPHPTDTHGMRFDYGEDGNTERGWSGKFRGWVQFRKTLPNEAVFRA